jgi:uncharacterized RDD family membrane protein YckC
VASKGLRTAARAIDALVELVLVVGTLVAFGDLNRPWTGAFLSIAAIAGYEALATRWWGGTLGKRSLGLRVVRLDRRGHADLPAALRRGTLHATFLVVPPIIGIVGLALLLDDGARDGVAVLLGVSMLLAWWVLSAVGDPLGRGFADRVADTMVVPDRFARTVSARDLPGYADGARPPRIGPWGRIADADVRARARLHRLDDAPVLAAAVGLLVLAAALIPADGGSESDGAVNLLLLGGTALWVALFVAHETRLVAQRGATPGHELAGLTIVSRTDGGPPRRGRSLLRALVLGLTLYVPLLWPLLAVSLLMMRSSDAGRGLHDLAGGTVVVSDPRLAPEEQRQRSMRLRLGRAG